MLVLVVGGHWQELIAKAKELLADYKWGSSGGASPVAVHLRVRVHVAPCSARLHDVTSVQM